MYRMLLILSIGYALGSGFWLTGCTVLEQSAQPAPLPAVSMPAPAPEQPGAPWRATHFEDIMVPSEFDLDYDQSYIDISDGGRRRIADLRYTGSPSPTKALSGIQREMLRSGWSLESLSGVSIKSLRYSKAGEECDIIIRAADDGETVIVVRVQPAP